LVGRCVERKAKWVTQTISVYLMNRGPTGDERIVRWNAIFAVATYRVRAARGESGIDRINAEDFPKHRGKILAVADGVVVAIADIIGSAAVA